MTEYVEEKITVKTVRIKSENHVIVNRLDVLEILNMLDKTQDTNEALITYLNMLLRNI